VERPSRLRKYVVAQPAPPAPTMIQSKMRVDMARAHPLAGARMKLLVGEGPEEQDDGVDPPLPSSSERSQPTARTRPMAGSR
jgi:hypothetical protein